MMPHSHPRAESKWALSDIIATQMKAKSLAKSWVKKTRRSQRTVAKNDDVGAVPITVSVTNMGTVKCECLAPFYFLPQRLLSL